MPQSDHLNQGDRTIHQELEIPDFHVFCILKSLETRKFVTEIFNWQHHYYFLTAEGVAYLRTYLGLPETIVPKTQKIDASEIPVQDTKEENGERGGPRKRGGRGRATEA